MLTKKLKSTALIVLAFVMALTLGLGLSSISDKSEQGVKAAQKTYTTNITAKTGSDASFEWAFSGTSGGMYKIKGATASYVICNLDPAETEVEVTVTATSASNDQCTLDAVATYVDGTTSTQKMAFNNGKTEDTVTVKFSGGSAIKSIKLEEYYNLKSEAKELKIPSDGVVIVAGAAHTHVWGEWVVTKEPTCTETGTKQRVCTATADCTGINATETDVVPAKGHTFGDAVRDVEPTCTTEGHESGTCSVCGQTTEQVVPALGHSYGEWQSVTAATCTEAGSEKRTCSVCNDEETREVAALGHDLVNDECTRCGSVKVVLTVNASEYTTEEQWDSHWVLTDFAYDATNGWQTKGLGSIKYAFDEPVTVLKASVEYVYGTKDKKSNYLSGSLSIDNGADAVAKKEFDIISRTTTAAWEVGEPALDVIGGATVLADAVNFEVEVNAGPKPLGVSKITIEYIASLKNVELDVIESQYAAQVGDVTTSLPKLVAYSGDGTGVANIEWNQAEVAAALASVGTHTVTGVVNAPAGYLINGKKSVVLTVTVVTTEKTHEHNWVESQVITEATCVSEGVMEYACDYVGDDMVACEITKQETIPMVDHTPEAIEGKAPTCTTAGWAEGSKCSECGTILLECAPIAALGHDFVDGDCTRCTASQYLKSVNLDVFSDTDQSTTQKKALTDAMSAASATNYYEGEYGTYGDYLTAHGINVIGGVSFESGNGDGFNGIKLEIGGAISFTLRNNATVYMYAHSGASGRYLDITGAATESIDTGATHFIKRDLVAGEYTLTSRNATKNTVFISYIIVDDGTSEIYIPAANTNDQKFISNNKENFVGWTDGKVVYAPGATAPMSPANKTLVVYKPVTATFESAQGAQLKITQDAQSLGMRFEFIVKLNGIDLSSLTTIEEKTALANNLFTFSNDGANTIKLSVDGEAGEAVEFEKVVVGADGIYVYAVKENIALEDGDKLIKAEVTVELGTKTYTATSNEYSMNQIADAVKDDPSISDEMKVAYGVKEAQAQ